MHELINLPYQIKSLEPYISEQTINFHYGKHHAAYVNKLNELLADLPQFADLSLKDLLVNIQNVPETKRQAVFNNAGQVFNHDFYWLGLTPDSSKFPTNKIGELIDTYFKNFENFKLLWREAGIGQFGSGWVWLTINEKGALTIEKTANADNPVFQGRTPLLTMDVWEHAYYLDYQNRRPDYIDNFFHLINWQEVESRYLDSTTK